MEGLAFPHGRAVGRVKTKVFCGFGRAGTDLLPTPMMRTYAHAYMSNTLHYLSIPSIFNSDDFQLRPTHGFLPFRSDTMDRKMEGAPINTGFQLEGPGLPWTFDMVQDRLVEAMITCWRGADRERGWLRVKSAWPEIAREATAGDYDARGGDGSSSDVALKPASLTRMEVAEMEEAFGWVAGLDPNDRRLIGIVIVQLARGAREVSWSRLLGQLGLAHGADGLRKRYSRAIASICDAKNGGNPREFPSTL